MALRIRRFVENNKEGTLSRLMTLGGVFHASRLDEDHIFGTVELTLSQIKTIDAMSEITLLPAGIRPISESKNPDPITLTEHINALLNHGISLGDAAEDVAEILAEKFGNPGIH